MYYYYPLFTLFHIFVLFAEISFNVMIQFYYKFSQEKKASKGYTPDPDKPVCESEGEQELRELG